MFNAVIVAAKDRHAPSGYLPRNRQNRLDQGWLGDYAMATELNYPDIIKKILLAYARYDSADSEIETTVSFDDEHCNYALLQAGWRGDDYLHGAIIHIRLIDGKIWVQYDGTE